MSITTEFKARIVDNFTEIMREYWEYEDDINYSRGKDFRDLAKRITGQIVTIIKEEYPEYKHAESDYFEKIDNNQLLSPQSFVRI